MNEAATEVVALFSVIGLGLALGKICWKGISLGTSGVVFTALIAGHYGFRVPAMSGTVGVVLFVYCMGIGAGPSFLRMFFRQGKSLALMAVAMICSAGAAAWAIGTLLDVGPGLVGGLFAGAMTSTPALAAATEHLPSDPEIAVGFGVAYPFGVIAVILFVQVLPRLSREALNSEMENDENLARTGAITRMLVHVKNPGVTGKRLRDVSTISHANCQVSRLLVEGQLKPIPPDFRLQPGQQVLVVGRPQRFSEVVDVLGERCEDAGYVWEVERQRRRVVVTSKELIGRSLDELHLLSSFGVTISRITRQDVEFVPSADERIEYGDALTAVGEDAALDKFVKFAGHRERTLDETDLVSLTVGIVLGVVVGSVELALNGYSISLGMAGGPLLVGLLLGHYGRIGPIVARIPRASRLLLSDIGLALFLAQAGSKAGDQFLQVLRQHGLLLPICSAILVVVPLIAGFAMARFVLRLTVLETIGGICGSMTSTPGLGAITSAVDSSQPATSYAAVYPLALILITLITPLLIGHLS